MAYKTKKISDVMQDIHGRRIYLPAIQRKYVWDVEQISGLMDSIMRGYPFGTFLFWKVEKDSVNKNQYALYEFICCYDERNGNNNKLVSLPLNVNKEDPESSIAAVLDGQQRLTSLNIALNGEIIVKLPKKHKNNPNAYVTKELYFDLLSKAYGFGNQNGNMADDSEVDEEENIPIKSFDFLTDEEAGSQNKTGKHLWYKVKNVMRFADIVSLNSEIRRLDDVAAANLTSLWAKIKSDELINYYEVDKNSMDQVLDIFVRVNSAGTVLSKTDLLFSTVVASWEKGREEFDELLKQINEIGDHYRFTNDFLMRTSLYVIDLPTALKVSLLTTANINNIQKNWVQIKEAITDTVYLLNDLGFNEENINSYSSIIPLVYYRYKQGKGAFKQEGVPLEIRKYLVVAHLNQVFGRATNSTLTAIRKKINDSLKKSETFKLSWFKNLKFTGDTSLTCSAAIINGWFDELEKGPQTFMVLSLLYPNLKYGQVGFHQDHMHPYSAFEDTAYLLSLKLKDGTSPDDAKIALWRHQRNTLANLQLLEGRDNQSKNNISLKKWLSIPENEKSARYLPKGISLDLANFDEFLAERKKLMIAELEKILL